MDYFLFKHLDRETACVLRRVAVVPCVGRLLNYLILAFGVSTAEVYSLNHLSWLGFPTPQSFFHLLATAEGICSDFAPVLTWSPEETCEKACRESGL